LKSIRGVMQFNTQTNGQWKALWFCHHDLIVELCVEKSPKARFISALLRLDDYRSHGNQIADDLKCVVVANQSADFIWNVWLWPIRLQIQIEMCGCGLSSCRFPLKCVVVANQIADLIWILWAFRTACLADRPCSRDVAFMVSITVVLRLYGLHSTLWYLFVADEIEGERNKLLYSQNRGQKFLPVNNRPVDGIFREGPFIKKMRSRSDFTGCFKKYPCKMPGDQVRKKKLYWWTWSPEPYMDIFCNTV
jgi:hypothetical protein